MQGGAYAGLCVGRGGGGGGGPERRGLRKLISDNIRIIIFNPHKTEDQRDKPLETVRYYLLLKATKKASNTKLYGIFGAVKNKFLFKRA